MKKLLNTIYIFFFISSLIFTNSISCTSTLEFVKNERQDSAKWSDIIAFAKENLPLYGTLQMKEKGYVYLKVDDEYIHTLFPKLELEADGYKKPPYFRSKSAPGAHISIFYEEENIRPEELGQVFRFELSQIKLVGARYATYVVLQVQSPELEALRIKYGNPPKLKNYEFHISLAKKKRR